MTNRLLPFFLLTCILQTSILAQKSNGPAPLTLRSGEHAIPLNEAGVLTTKDLADWPTAQGMKYGVVALEQAPDRQTRASLKTRGIEVLEFLPTHYYMVAIAQGAELALINQLGVAQAAPYLPEFKWVADRHAIPSRAIVSNDVLAVNVMTYANVGSGLLVSVLSSLDGVRVVDVNETFHYVQIEVEQDALSTLAEVPAVATIEWVYPEGQPENYTSRTLTRTRYLSYDNSNGINYDGSGVSVGIQDNGAIGPHIDYHGRIMAQFTTEDEGDHGDHVTGTVGGAGNLNPWHQGQAEGTDLYIYKAWPEYNAISNMDSHYVNYDLYLTSTSYSDGCNAGYTSRTRTIDQQSYNYEKLIHVYSAGNSGTSNCGYGAGSTWGNVTGGHKMAKGAITVGNLTENYLLATSSSRGPAYDGRIKPDICAQGTSVTSTIAGNLYDTYTGTSMSCPNVAGALSVLYEAFEDVHGEAPDGGLMKGIVLNTADDIGNQGPDFKHGWGRLNGRQAFHVIQEGTFITDSLANGNNPNVHQITVPSGVSRVRVMVYWTDPAASVSASTALINDLDLKGITPAQDTLLPYVLDDSPNIATLDDPAVPGVDHLNNMEQIELFDPEAGTYSFEVSPYYIPLGPQEYFLIYYIEDDPMVLTYPVGGEPFTPFSTENIRWDSELEGTLDIQLSEDGGATWSNIATGVDAEQEYYQWSVPMMAQGDVRIRLVHDSATAESADLSVMSTPANVHVSVACPDSIILQWDPLGQATSFDIYKLGSKYMDSIGTSTIPEFVDYSSNPYSTNLWYAVSADGPEAAQGKRSISIQKSPGLVNCFLSDDLNALAVTPDISQVFPCHGTELNIGFVVENAGVTPSIPFMASLYGPNGLITSDSFTTSLSPLDIDTFAFASGVVLDSGLHTYAVVLDMDGDMNHYNDTAFKPYEPTEGQSILPLWVEHFDNFSFICSSDPDCGATMCPLPESWINEENALFDDIDWRVSEGATPSSFTGPYGDNSTPGAQGKYIYLESSGGCTGQEARLISPCIDLSMASAPILTFYYSMYGADMGELHVDVYDGDEWHLDFISPISGNQGTGWNPAEVDLSAFNGMNINVRFRGITGDGFYSDMALDDISIIHPPVANFEYFTQPNGETVLFNDLSTYSDSMFFDLGDGTLPTDSVPSEHNYAVQQAHSVTQIVGNAFGTDSLTLVIENLGESELGARGLNVYPNPASAVVMVESLNGMGIQKAELWSMDGRLVMRSMGRNANKVQLDVRMLSAGAYVLKVTSDQVTEMPLLIGQ